MLKKLHKYSITHTKICIIGGGTGGLSIATHLMRQNINASDIRVFDDAEKHYYQPGWTMVGAKLCNPQLTVKSMKQVWPFSVPFTRSNVKKISTGEQIIETQSGEVHSYDHLIVASGFKYNWDKVKGAKQALLNPDTQVGSIYTLQYAKKTAQLCKKFTKGKAIFSQPTHPIKCAGAPQKIMYLWADRWRKKMLPIDIEYIKATGVMFDVPKYSKMLQFVAKDYQINCEFFHNLIEIKNGNVAVFQNVATKDKVEKNFDFLHMVPPMGPHQFISQSGLGDTAGFLDVDKHTLQHVRQPNVWGLGDCTNTPNSKTAAAIFQQTIILTKNIVSALNLPKTTPPARYEGYASCPLFVGKGKIVLAQFKYDHVVDETFFKDQEKPRRIFYFMKRYFLPYTYWGLVPRGLWNGRRGINL